MSSIGQVTTDYIFSKQGVKKVLSTTGKVVDWTELFRGVVSESALFVRKSTKHMKHFIDVIDLPSSLKRLYNSATHLKDAALEGSVFGMTKKTTKVFIRSALAIELITSTIEMGHKFELFTLSAKQLSVIAVFGFLGSVALLVSGLYGVVKQTYLLTQEKFLSSKFNLTLIRIATNLTFCALGVFSLAGWILGAPIVAKWIALSTATMLIALGVGGHFYNKIYVDVPEIDAEIEIDEVEVDEPQSQSSSE